MELLELSFSNVTYSVKKGEKVILDSLCGRFKAGQLTAILGPSGAGKTSLMSFLAGVKSFTAQGKLCVNGQERTADEYRKISAYITQKDFLLPHLTVQEYLNFAAKLKMHRSLSAAEKTRAVDEVIDTLGLEDCRNTCVRDLSGGECKRLSVALELLSNPRIIFLDEPTSGLDSASSLQCVSLLSKIAARGRVVVATIHQPSARLLEKFSNLYVIAKGRCIYHGEVGQLVPSLNSLNLKCPNFHNPADFVIDVASSDDAALLQDLVNLAENGNRHFRDTDATETDPSEKAANGNPSSITEATSLLEAPSDELILKDSYATSMWTQFWVLLHRTFISIWREKMLTLLRFVAHIVVGVLMGLLYWKVGNDASKVYSNAGLIFFTQLFLLFTAMMPTVLTFPLERHVLVREHLNHWYSLKSYYLAKTTADLPFQIVFPTLYLVTVYFMTDQVAEFQRFCMFLLMSILLSLVAQGFGLLVGAAANIQIAVFLAPACTIPFLLFSGFFLTLSAIPSYLQWLSYLSFIRYVFEGSLLSVYGGERSSLVCREPYCHFKFPAKFLEELDMHNSSYLVDVVCLLAYFIVIRIAGYFVLRWKVQRTL